jgi:D-threo-aldose 1-dehydrogenase
MRELDLLLDRVPLAHGAVTATRIGFGCGGLIRVPSQRDRQRLLATAFDSGIRHFDVAPMYGLGAAEAELGRFSRGKRDLITIATKFGIEPAPVVARLAGLQAPARAVMARFPAVRAAIKRRGEAFNAPRRYDAQVARRSLDRSLSEVGTEYFDILFVHDPSPQDEVMVDELLEFFRQACNEGKIRGWGVAGASPTIGALAARLGAEAAVQVPYALLAPHFTRGSGDGGRIVFGAVGSTLGRLSAYLDADPRRRQQWASALGVQPLTNERLGELLVTEALDANNEAVVLLGSTRATRIERAAELLRSGADSGRLAALRGLAAEASAKLEE